MRVLCLAAALAAAPVSARAQDPAVAEPAPPGSWTMEIISRPLTLPTGLLRVQGDLAVVRTFAANVDDPALPGTSATGINLVASGGYGVSDQLEVGGAYALALKEFEPKGTLTVYGLYRLADGRLKLAPGAALSYNVASERAGLGAGLAVQYDITPRLAVFAPASQLGVGFDPTSAAIDLPVGLMLQAGPNVNVQLRTSIATIGIDPSGSSVIVADRTPLLATAFYSSSNTLDIGISLDTGNLPDVADAFSIILTARLFVM